MAVCLSQVTSCFVPGRTELPRVYQYLPPAAAPAVLIRAINSAWLRGALKLHPLLWWSLRKKNPKNPSKGSNLFSSFLQVRSALQAQMGVWCVKAAGRAGVPCSVCPGEQGLCHWLWLMSMCMFRTQQSMAEGKVALLGLQQQFPLNSWCRHISPSDFGSWIADHPSRETRILWLWETQPSVVTHLISNSAEFLGSWVAQFLLFSHYSVTWG